MTDTPDAWAEHESVTIPTEGWVNIYPHGACADFETEEQSAKSGGRERIGVAHYKLVEFRAAGVQS